jgi:hypothetical protein
MSVAYPYASGPFAISFTRRRFCCGESLLSAQQFQGDTGLGSYQTAWTLLHKLRSTLKPRAGFRLRGLVEADETYLGASRERGVVGRRVVGKAIVGVAMEQREHTAGKARLAVLEGISFDDLGPFVRGVIDGHDATIRTDGWKGCQPLQAAGVPHDPHTQGKDFARSAKLMPWSHRVFSNLKAWIRGTFHRVSRKHLGRYSSSCTASIAAGRRRNSSGWCCDAQCRETRFRITD